MVNVCLRFGFGFFMALWMFKRILFVSSLRFLAASMSDPLRRRFKIIRPLFYKAFLK